MLSVAILTLIIAGVLNKNLDSVGVRKVKQIFMTNTEDTDLIK